MMLALLFIGLLVTVSVGFYSAWLAHTTLRKEDYEIEFYELMSSGYLKLIQDEERLARLVRVKKWTSAFLIILVSYLAGSLAMALSMNLAA